MAAAYVRKFAWLVPYLFLASALLQTALLICVLFLAGSNVRAGRVDRRSIAFLVSITTPLVNAPAAMVLVALFRRYMSAMWLVAVCSAFVLTMIENPAIGNFHGHRPQLLAVGFVTALLTVIVFVRYGLLAGFFANYSRYALTAAFTLDSGRAHFHSSVAIAAVIVTLAVIGWRMAHAEEPALVHHPMSASNTAEFEVPGVRGAGDERKRFAFTAHSPFRQVAAVRVPPALQCPEVNWCVPFRVHAP